jgi:hypothetical protein
MTSHEEMQMSIRRNLTRPLPAVLLALLAAAALQGCGKGPADGTLVTDASSTAAGPAAEAPAPAPAPRAETPQPPVAAPQPPLPTPPPAVQQPPQVIVLPGPPAAPKAPEPPTAHDKAHHGKIAGIKTLRRDDASTKQDDTVVVGYRIAVKLDNGRMREFEQPNLRGFKVGMRVRIDDGELHRI